MSSGVSSGEVNWRYPLSSGTNCDRYGTLQLDFKGGARSKAYVEVVIKRELFSTLQYKTTFHMCDIIENGFGR